MQLVHRTKDIVTKYKTLLFDFVRLQSEWRCVTILVGLSEYILQSFKKLTVKKDFFVLFFVQSCMSAVILKQIQEAYQSEVK